MIEVLSFEKGVRVDTAEAADPDAAVFAAQTLLSDFLSDARKRRAHFTAGFYVDGVLVRMAVPADLCPVAIPATV